MGAVREGRTWIFVAVSAQRIDILGLGLLRVRVVARFALNAGFCVLAGVPLVRRRLVARGAQRGIGRNRHLHLRVSGLIGAVTRFARDAFELVRAIDWIVAGGVALQARVLVGVFGPGFLKNRRRESPGVKRGGPLGVYVLVAAAAQFRATIFAGRSDLRCRLNQIFIRVRTGRARCCCRRSRK